MKCNNCNHHHAESEPHVCTLLDCNCDQDSFAPFQETKGIDYYRAVIKKMENTSDRIEYLLKEIPEFRNLNNKERVLVYWHYYSGYVVPASIKNELTDPETINRSWRKVVEINPILGPSNEELIKSKEIKENSIKEWAVMSN